MRSTVAAAHKLPRMIVAALRDKRPYIGPGIDYGHRFSFPIRP